MGWQTKTSGNATSIPNVTLGQGNYRLVLVLPNLPLLGDLLGRAAAAVAGVVPGTTNVDTNGNTVYVYFTVAAGGGGGGSGGGGGGAD